MRIDQKSRNWLENRSVPSVIKSIYFHKSHHAVGKLQTNTYQECYYIYVFYCWEDERYDPKTGQYAMEKIIIAIKLILNWIHW